MKLLFSRVASVMVLVLLAVWADFGHIPNAFADLPRVGIVIGQQAPPLERFASEELKGILKRLYQVEVSVGTEPAKDSDYLILLGQDSTNPQLRQALPQSAAQLSDQGLMLQSIEGSPPQLILRGGSPVASLWAVYELGERLGIQYLSDRDVYPTTEPSPWKSLPTFSSVMEPNLRIRCWRLVNEHAMGPAAWSLEENQRFIKQLAKMKFNRIHAMIWPTQPFVKYSFQGIPNGPGVMFFGARFPIDADMIGHDKFGKMTVFMNPEFVGASDNELHERARALLQGIIEQSKSLGMEMDLGIIPTQWPKQYLGLIPGAELYPDEFGNLTCGPGPKTPVTDPALWNMVTTVVRASIETYPNIDFIRFEFPELPVWYEPGKQSYQDLARRYDLSVLGSFDELCTKARARSSFPGGGQRVERSMCESLATLDLIDNLIRERSLLKRPGGGTDILLILSSVTEELMPLLPQLLPPGGEYVSAIDYTASRQLKRIDLLHQQVSKGVSRLLSLTLADDNVGVLPQMAGRSIQKVLAEMRANNWAGFSTRYWNIAEQDPVTHYMSRACWDADVTPQQAYADQLLHICGPESVKPALEAFATIEQITLSLDEHGLGFGFPIHNMMEKHADTAGLTSEMKEVRNLYQQALAKMQEAKALSKPGGEFFLAYFVERLKFAVNYMNACDDFGIASAALKSGNREAARKNAAAALTAINTALQTEADAARDHGELGAVATMEEYCRKPIKHLVDVCKQNN